MNNIDSITIQNLKEAIKSLRKQLMINNALEYLKFKYQLENLDKNNYKYLEALNYIQEPHFDLPLDKVENIIKKYKK